MKTIVKQLKSNIYENEKTNKKIMPKDATTFELVPSQEHLIDPKMRIHYYMASNQFYRMLSKMTNSSLPKKHLSNPQDAIESITYIHNENLEAEYDHQRKKIQDAEKD